LSWEEILRAAPEDDHISMMSQGQNDLPEASEVMLGANVLWTEFWLPGGIPICASCGVHTLDELLSHARELRDFVHDLTIKHVPTQFLAY
jgi:hypothetical protein